MPLMSCFECGREISEYADVCLGCGYVLKSRPHEDATNEHVEYWLWKHTGWKWRVLKRESGCTSRVLVLTDDVLEVRSFDDGTADVVTWEKCALRRYLNGPFLGDLHAEVRERIATIWNSSTTDEDEADRYSRAGFVEDKIFLLSEHEVALYLKDGDEADDEDDSSGEYEERSVSPLEAWQEDGRQYSKSSYDEWEGEYDSVCQNEADYWEMREWQLLDEIDREDSRRGEWRERGWWLRTTVESQWAPVSNYGIHGSRSLETEWYSPTAPSGVRVALCVDISSHPNLDLDTPVMKPGWRAKRGESFEDDILF